MKMQTKEMKKRNQLISLAWIGSQNSVEMNICFVDSLVCWHCVKSDKVELNDCRSDTFESVIQWSCFEWAIECWGVLCVNRRGFVCFSAMFRQSYIEPDLAELNDSTERLYETFKAIKAYKSNNSWHFGFYSSWISIKTWQFVACPLVN